jgi:uncharacterized protein (TIGR00369 family)
MTEESRLSLEAAQRLLDGSPFGRWWGYRIEAVGPGTVRLRLPFQPGFERPGGVLQGGCAMTLADVAFWLAGMTITGEEAMALTLQVTSSFLRPAGLGDLHCEARVLRSGRKVIYGEASCRDAKGNVVTHHVLTYLRPEQGGAERPGG